MSKKQKFMRLMISGTLLAAVALVGASVYQVDVSQQKKREQLLEAEENKSEELQKNLQESNQEPVQESVQGGNSTAGLDEVEPHYAVIDDEEEEVQETENAASQDVTAQLDKNASPDENKNVKEKTAKDGENTVDQSVSTAGGDILSDVNFTDDVLMNWPVEGTVLMDYSMDRSIYFETLNVYKYNPSLVLSTEEGEPVEAVANMKILSIADTLETGTTITADMGNGYQVVYGQLKDVCVAENDVVKAGTVLGYVSEPTKYYTKEGTNLYFSMTKDGTSIDPVLYLP